MGRKMIFFVIIILGIFCFPKIVSAKYVIYTDVKKIIQIHQIDKVFDEIKLSAPEAGDERNYIYDLCQ